MLFDLNKLPVLLLSLLLPGLLWIPSADPKVAPDPTRPNKMLLVLFDGFRWDYIEKFDLKGFRRFEQRGSRAQALRPQFPSLSLPGFYSMATGMYPEQHGIVSNSMYDPQSHDVFDVLGLATVNATWWQESDPLWVGATRAGLRTHVYLWPGCNAVIRGVRPAGCRFGSPFYYTTFNLERYLDEALNMFEKDQADLVMIYHESPDLLSQLFGPESWVTRQVVSRLSEIMNRFADKMESRGMTDKVNVLLTSDHGMTQAYFNSSHAIHLRDTINMDDVTKLLDYGANTWIFPAVGKLEQIVSKLKGVRGIKVSRKQDIPVEYHIKENKRTPPILVEADPGYYIMPLLFSSKQVPFTIFPYYQGYHGFDVNQVNDMKGFFIAAGPEIRENVTIPEVELVDIYALASNLLQLPPKPMNGSIERVAGMLRTPMTDPIKKS